jgi:hypothetical protein
MQANLLQGFAANPFLSILGLTGFLTATLPIDYAACLVFSYPVVAGLGIEAGSLGVGESG